MALIKISTNYDFKQKHTQRKFIVHSIISKLEEVKKKFSIPDKIIYYIIHRFYVLISFSNSGGVYFHIDAIDYTLPSKLLVLFLRLKSLNYQRLKIILVIYSWRTEIIKGDTASILCQSLYFLVMSLSEISILYYFLLSFRKKKSD